MEEALERAILVSLDLGYWDVESALAELEELARTAGAEVVGTLVQKRENPDRATCIGSGKLEELKLLAETLEAELIIFDTELTPSQLRNLEKVVDTRVIDRTMLILDIFAGRANSAEGKLQVELAQLRYSLPRLTGKGTELSRLGGGIGTRGPGESKLESDKRHIHRRISALANELQELTARRGRLRARRRKEGVTTVAIVGYTNAGKSTLLNRLTGAGVLAEDKLFATLDPTSRALTLGDGQKVLLIDTVGLIRRLPHHLIEAFRSTLEEAASASLIVHLCDASSPELDEHIRVTNDLLDSLGAGLTPRLCVLNKADIATLQWDLPLPADTVHISALTGDGLDELLQAISDKLPPTRRLARLLLPYADGSIAAALRRDGIVQTEKYTEDGLYLEVVADSALLEIARAYEI
ncbi:MAG: GTPase HflX [Oscillospiraceae bacterium]|jgi:GTP-binding protein HflX|nr:GTPase HflX [Oscillospiraceae bacterium]